MTRARTMVKGSKCNGSFGRQLGAMGAMCATHSHKMKGMQIHGLSGLDGPGGKPADAIQYVPPDPPPPARAGQS